MLGLQLAQSRLELFHALQRFKRRAFQVHVDHRQTLAPDRPSMNAASDGVVIAMAGVVAIAIAAAAIRATASALIAAANSLGEHVNEYARAVALSNGRPLVSFPKSGHALTTGNGNKEYDPKRGNLKGTSRIRL
jgi:hypothetical protein